MRSFSKVNLDYLVRSSIDNATNEDEINDEVKIFQNALDFSDTKVHDAYDPYVLRFRLLKMDTSLEELQQKFIEGGNSKIIVYEEDKTILRDIFARSEACSIILHVGRIISVHFLLCLKRCRRRN